MSNIPPGQENLDWELCLAQELVAGDEIWDQPESGAEKQWMEITAVGPVPGSTRIRVEFTGGLGWGGINRRSGFYRKGRWDVIPAAMVKPGDEIGYGEARVLVLDWTGHERYVELQLQDPAGSRSKVCIQRGAQVRRYAEGTLPAAPLSEMSPEEITALGRDIAAADPIVPEDKRAGQDWQIRWLNQRINGINAAIQQLCRQRSEIENEIDRLRGRRPVTER